MEYYIDIENNFNKKSFMRRFLNEYLDIKRTNDRLYKEKEDMKMLLELYDEMAKWED